MHNSVMGNSLIDIDCDWCCTEWFDATDCDDGMLQILISQIYVLRIWALREWGSTGYYHLLCFLLINLALTQTITDLDLIFVLF